MRLVGLTILFTGLLGLLAATTPQADACPPGVGVPASTYSYAATTYVPATTYYQQTAVLAYPLTLLAVPAVAVPAQPVVQPTVPPAAPASAPVPQAEVQTQAVLPQATVVQRAVVQTYATPLAAVSTYGCSTCGVSAGVGYGYGSPVLSRGIVRNRAVVIERQRRVGPVRNLFSRIRANRAARGNHGVPASTIIIR